MSDMAARKGVKWVHGDEVFFKSTEYTDNGTSVASVSDFNGEMRLPIESTKDENSGLEMANYSEVPSIFDCGYSFEKTMAEHEKNKTPTRKRRSKIERIMQMIENFQNFDIEIHCHKFTFRCHSLVLQCYSEFFQNLKNVLIVELPDEVTPVIFSKIYDWMLADDYDLHVDDLLEMYKVASILGIKCLSTQCFMCLDNRDIFREDTAFAMYRKALELDVESIVDLMLSRICKYFLSLIATRDYLNLTCAELLPLLSSSNIGVNTEIEVFFAAIRWLNYSYEVRKAHLIHVISCVRFSLIPPWFLISLNKEPMCAEVQRIAEEPEVRDQINSGISYITTQLYCKGNPQKFSAFLSESKFSVVQERQWIFDPNCLYHLRNNCKAKEYITYERYLSQLVSVRSLGKDYWQKIELILDDHLSYLFSLRRDGEQLIPPTTSQ